MARKGAKVLVLEKYIIPGGSAGQFEREGFKFDVGSSMMFGLSEATGGTNLITQALKHVGKRVETIPDPTQLEYHLPRSNRFPEGLNVRVWRHYDDFIDELVSKFPHQEEGIKGFYGECWKVGAS
jgi:prolycopene isomerase